MFDELGNPLAGYPTFPAMQGVMPSTPYMDLMNAPSRSMASIMASPSVTAPALDLTAQLPTNVPMLNSIGAAPKSIWDNFLGSPGQQGWGGLAIGAASGLMNGYLGLQQLGVAKKTLKQNERQFNLNFGAQQKMTNSRLADRQATRLASGLTNVGVDQYMAKYGI